MKFVLTGKPIPKMRARTVRKGRFTSTYDPQEKEKCFTRQSILSQIKQNKFTNEYLIVNIKFYFLPALSLSIPIKNKCFWFEFPTSCDLDNLAKYYLDCMNGFAFNDDRRIVKMTASKHFGTVEKTEIEIMPKMTAVNEEIEKILSIYGPNQICSLLEIVWELGELYNADEFDDWVADEVGTDEVREVRLTRTAYLISKLAYNHANLLKKVDRSASGFWQRAEQIAKKAAKNE